MVNRTTKKQWQSVLISSLADGALWRITTNQLELKFVIKIPESRTKHSVSHAQKSKLQRNAVLEEVAQAFDKMPFGDTAASFARYVRDMKK
jgi:hypothetical protein